MYTELCESTSYDVRVLDGALKDTFGDVFAMQIVVRIKTETENTTEIRETARVAMAKMLGLDEYRVNVKSSWWGWLSGSHITMTVDFVGFPVQDSPSFKHNSELKRGVLLRWTHHHMNGTFGRYSFYPQLIAIVRSAVGQNPQMVVNIQS